MIRKWAIIVLLVMSVIFLIVFLIKNQKDKKALIQAVNAEDQKPPEHDIEDYKA